MREMALDPEYGLQLGLRGDATIPAGPRWTWGEKCEEEGMVNCAFGERGGCLNTRHQGAADALRSGEGWALCGA